MPAPIKPGFYWVLSDDISWTQTTVDGEPADRWVPAMLDHMGRLWVFGNEESIDAVDVDFGPELIAPVTERE